MKQRYCCALVTAYNYYTCAKYISWQGCYHLSYYLATNRKMPWAGLNVKRWWRKLMNPQSIAKSAMSDNNTWSSKPEKDTSTSYYLISMLMWELESWLSGYGKPSSNTDPDQDGVSTAYSLHVAHNYLLKYISVILIICITPARLV